MRSTLSTFSAKLRTPAAAMALAVALYVQWSLHGLLHINNHTRPRVFSWTLHREEDGALSATLTSEAEPSSPERCVVVLRIDDYKYGRWAPMKRVRHVRFTFMHCESLSSYEQQQAIALVSDDYALRCPERKQEIAALRSRDLSHSELIWTGVVVDGLAIATGLLMLYSFSSAPSWFAPARRRRRIRRGLCPHCRYDLRGLAAPCCPECGTALDGGDLP